MVLHLKPGLALLAAVAVTTVGWTAHAAEQDAIVVCSPGVPTTLDPARPYEASVVPIGVHQVFDRLVAVADDGLTVEPRLARWWDIVDGGRAVIFKLRRGVTYHGRDDFTPSRPLGPEDVVFSFERLIDPDHPFRPADEVHYDFASVIESVSAEDDDRVRFVLKAPHAGFLQLMAMDDASIQSQEFAATLVSAEARSALHDRPIGTGPFKVESRDGDTLSLAPHAGHWSGQPPASGLVFTGIGDALGRYQATVDRTCDLTISPDIADLDDLKQRAGVEIVTLPHKAVVFLAFNTARPPMDRRRLRRALAGAIDATVRPEGAVAAERVTAVRPIVQPSNPEVNGPGPSAAPAPDTGEPDRPLSLLTAVITPGGRDPVADAIARIWEGSGAKTTVAAMAWDGFWTAWETNEHDAALIAFEPDTPDEAVTLSELLTCGTEGAGNVARWCHQGFEEAVAGATGAADPESRALALARAFELLAEEKPIVPLFRPALNVAVSRSIEGADAASLLRGDLQNLVRTGPEPESAPPASGD